MLKSIRFVRVWEFSYILIKKADSMPFIPLDEKRRVHPGETTPPV